MGIALRNHGARMGASALALFAMACSEADPAPQRPAPKARQGSPSQRVHELAALGYSDWDGPTHSTPVGAIVHDRAAVAAGWNLYADDRERVYAVDIDGDVRREWHIPGRTQVEFALPLAGGRLLALSVDEGLTLLEPDGSVVWALDIPAHHDVCVRPGGLPGERLFAVATHRRRNYRGRSVSFDRIRFVSESTGELLENDTYRTLDSWSLRAAWGDVQRVGAGIEHPLDTPPSDGPAATDSAQAYDYFHLNSIQWELGPAAPGGPAEQGARDRFLLCLRNVNTVISVDARTGEVLWHADPTELDWPHMPRRLVRLPARDVPAGQPEELSGAAAEPGDVIVFDNGKHRDWSRAVAFGADGKPTWEWRATPPTAFHSDARGSVQRLPNGNTLLAESERGRVIEVSPAGEIVWEFFNPERTRTRGGRERLRRIYRCLRYPVEWLAAPD